MHSFRRRASWVRRLAGVFVLVVLAVGSSALPIDEAQADPLPSWTEGPSKQAILDFLAVVTDPGSAAFVPAADRVATFDNDGTLWAEKPTYFQLYFTIDRIKSLAADNPGWATTQPFQAVLEGDRERMAAFVRDDLESLIAAAHANTTQTEFAAAAREFLARGWLIVSIARDFATVFSSATD